MLASLMLADGALAETFNFVLPPEKLSAGQAKQQREEVQKRTELALAPVNLLFGSL